MLHLSYTSLRSYAFSYVLSLNRCDHSPCMAVCVVHGRHVCTCGNMHCRLQRRAEWRAATKKQEEANREYFNAQRDATKKNLRGATDTVRQRNRVSLYPRVPYRLSAFIPSTSLLFVCYIVLQRRRLFLRERWIPKPLCCFDPFHFFPCSSPRSSYKNQ